MAASHGHSELFNGLVHAENPYNNPNFPDYMGRTIDGLKIEVYQARYAQLNNGRPVLSIDDTDTRIEIRNDNEPASTFLRITGDVGHLAIYGIVDKLKVSLEDTAESTPATDLVVHLLS